LFWYEIIGDGRPWLHRSLKTGKVRNMLTLIPAVAGTSGPGATTQNCRHYPLSWDRQTDDPSPPPQAAGVYGQSARKGDTIFFI
jgi:hypothetical protein